MTARRTPWPGDPATDEHAPGADAPPQPAPAADESALRARLAAAVDVSDAPDVVFAVSRHGRRTLHSGGTATPPDVSREDLRYETGSASKTFTALLLTRLIRRGVLTGGEAAVTCLDPGAKPGPHPVTLAHLLTHTSGLPALPADFVRRGLPAWRTNPYARYSAERLTGTFLRHPPTHRPGTRWRYSNYGVSVLGHAVAATVGTPWDHLITEQVLRALGLSGTALRAEGPETDAVGHRKDGRTPVPAFDAGGFQAQSCRAPSRQRARLAVW